MSRVDVGTLINALQGVGLSAEKILDVLSYLEESRLAGYRGPLLQADGLKCVYCGATEGAYHIDHVMPLSRGGSDDDSNKVVACAPCNMSKGSKTLEEWKPQRSPAAIRQARYRERLMQRNVTSRVTRDGITDVTGTDAAPRPVLRRKILKEMPADWQPDFDYAIAHGLTREKAEAEAIRFRDQASAKGYRYANWEAAWRNWVTSPYQGLKNGTNGHGGHGKHGLSEAFGSLIARAEESERDRKTTLFDEPGGSPKGG